MAITGMNHAVLYVRDQQRQRRFYSEVLGFSTVIDGPGPFVFMRAPASQNHHDIAFFGIGDTAGPSQAGGATVGLYHLAWEVSTLEELAEMQQRLAEAGALVGTSDHGVNKSLYAKDPDGLEFEVMWLAPAEHWGDDAHTAVIRPLDIAADIRRFAELQARAGAEDDAETSGDRAAPQGAAKGAARAAAQPEAQDAGPEAQAQDAS